MTDTSQSKSKCQSIRNKDLNFNQKQDCINNRFKKDEIQTTSKYKNKSNVLGKKFQSRRSIQSPPNRKSDRYNSNRKAQHSDSSTSSQKSKIILPQLKGIRPSTAVYSVSIEKKKNIHSSKDSLIYEEKVPTKSEVNMSIDKAKLKIESKNQRYHTLRPCTAPSSRNQGIDVQVKRSEHYYQDDGAANAVTHAHFLRRESFNVKQEAKQRKRAEVYAINRVMKAAFHRDFDDYMERKILESPSLE